jgi:D-xylulose reductase
MAPWYGTFSGYHIIASDFVYRVPDHMSMEEAALVKLVSVAAQIAKVADLRANQTVLVFECVSVGVL